MKKSKIVLFLMGFILLFSSCKSENKILNEFFEKERQNLLTEAKEVITILGMDNFEVLIYPHKGINNKVISKSSSFTDWTGTGYNPEGPSGPAGNQVPPAFSLMDNLYGRAIYRTVTAHYEPDMKMGVTYDYFSILIIFESISPAKADALIGILNSHIVNTERGDIVKIISKESFNKIE